MLGPGVSLSVMTLSAGLILMSRPHPNDTAHTASPWIARPLVSLPVSTSYRSRSAVGVALGLAVEGALAVGAGAGSAPQPARRATSTPMTAIAGGWHHDTVAQRLSTCCPADGAHSRYRPRWIRAGDPTRAPRPGAVPVVPCARRTACLLPHGPGATGAGAAVQRPGLRIDHNGGSGGPAGGARGDQPEDRAPAVPVRADGQEAHFVGGVVRWPSGVSSVFVQVAVSLNQPGKGVMRRAPWNATIVHRVGFVLTVATRGNLHAVTTAAYVGSETIGREPRGSAAGRPSRPRCAIRRR